MSRIARNPEHYTVGIPKLFFCQQTDQMDAHAVDGVALLRAYCGLVDLASGNVLNSDDLDTCLTDIQIMEKSYVGNIVSSELGGEITTVEHTASNEGRKEIDKIVLSRRSLAYTIGFDEINKQNMERFFAAQTMSFPTSDIMSGRTTATGAQKVAADFTEGVVELVDNAMTQIGTGSTAFEEILTSRLMAQNTDFSPVDINSVATSIAGVFYFLIGDFQRQPDIDSRLNAYRNKILCGFFKYDPTLGMMKLQSWPAIMDTANYGYPATTFDGRLRVYTSAHAETMSGIPTNDYVLDRASASDYLDVVHWNFNEASESTHALTIDLPPLVARSTVRVTMSGKKWDAVGSVWNTVSEVLSDYTQSVDATKDTVVLRSSDATNPSYFTDPTGTNITYSSGVLEIKAGAKFITDSTTNALSIQDVTITVSAFTLDTAKILWSGVTWANHDEMFTNLRVNRGKPEVMGPALIVHQNDVGVSFLHVIPRATMRADGTIDFAKDDWEKGSFVVTAIKSDIAYLPNLPRRLKMPFGATIAYKYRTVEL